MKSRRFSVSMRVVAACALSLAGLGCASREPGAGNSLGAVEVAIPQPAGDASMVRPGLAVNLTVLVAGKKTIEEVARSIAEDGTLEMPLVGTVAVGGMTPAQLGQELSARYAEFYVDPQVIVEFARSEQPDGVSLWGSITVLGRVKRPGRVNIPATRDLTVSMAIQQAGGFDTSAKDTAILVTRRTPEGGTTAIRVNLRDVGARGLREKDIVLQSEDLVYVPELVF